MKGQSSAAKLADFLTRTAQGKTYSVTIATIVLALLVFFAGIVPAFNATLLQYTENDKKVTAITDLRNKLANMQSLMAEEQNKAAYVQLLNKKLPDSLLEENVVLEIDRLTSQNSLHLISVNFSPLERRLNIAQAYGVNERVQAKYVSLDLEGDVQNINTFITGLEKNTYVFNITDLSFQRKERFNTIDLQSNNIYRLNLRFETFYWGTPATEQ